MGRPAPSSGARRGPAGARGAAERGAPPEAAGSQAARNGGAMTSVEQDSSVGQQRGSALEVLGVATRLGLTSFGGPIAHLGYFRDEYVVRRRWIDDPTYV